MRRATRQHHSRRRRDWLSGAEHQRIESWRGSISEAVLMMIMAGGGGG